MGYTHYWRGTAQLTETLHRQLSALLRHGSNLIRFEDFSNEPATLTSELIRFNGIGEEGHETFLIEWNKPTDFKFCKTAQKPYDTYVVAALILITTANSCTFNWSSDGDSFDHQAGRLLAAKIKRLTKFKET